MRTTIRIAGAAGFALAATTLIAGPASAGGASHEGAVFAMSDNLSGNTVVAYDRDTSGRLNQAGAYSTGGLGGQLTGSVVDHTASQGALALDDGLLYAVNAGSDTLTVFDVHGDRLSKRQVITSGGAFPVSVAVHGNLVYVLNARDGGSIQGYLRLGRTLVKVAGWHRALGLDPAATPEFTHTPGQIAFTPDGSRLIVTTKAGSNAIDVYAVDPLRGPSARPVVNAEPGAVPFAVTFDARGHLIVAEAGPSAVATFALGRDDTLTPLASTATGQAATCWIVGVHGTAYAGNAGSGNLSGYRVAPGGSLTSLGTFTTGAGQVDATATPDGRFLYAQTGAAGDVVALRIDRDGSLTKLGEVTVPGAAGGEGIVAS
jgi:6-phosphogluconolactonase (cycloisomerase 2 family)